MRIKLFLLVVTFLPLISMAQKQTKLFNGKNLKNWEIVLKEDAKGIPVFYVADGAINASGNPFGYIRTKKQYENYELTLEWRWPGTPTNSGVLLHINGPDGVWPSCMEAQLMNGKAGDMVLMQTGAKVTVENKQHEIKEGEGWVAIVAKLNESSENAPGEWNRYRIVSHKGKLELYVNDVMQNAGTDFAPNKGFIGLQSEGSLIQFRNIHLKKLK
jgi:hypothetical protein